MGARLYKGGRTQGRRPLPWRKLLKNSRRGQEDLPQQKTHHGLVECTVEKGRRSVLPSRVIQAGRAGVVLGGYCGDVYRLTKWGEAVKSRQRDWTGLPSSRGGDRSKNLAASGGRSGTAGEESCVYGVKRSPWYPGKETPEPRKFPVLWARDRRSSVEDCRENDSIGKVGGWFVRVRAG